ncbi:hypothetical protein Ancab_000650 [Ancistrocladus abbreviatus]
MPAFEPELSEHIDMLKLARSGRGRSRVTKRNASYPLLYHSVSPAGMKRDKKRATPNSARGAAPFLLVSIAYLFAISVQPHYRHPSPIVICTTRMPTTLQSHPTPAIRSPA